MKVLLSSIVVAATCILSTASAFTLTTVTTKPPHVLHMKNIVICCDGTGCDLSGNPTNVAQFFRSLEISDSQLSYYDPGVGTLNQPGSMTKADREKDKYLDLAFGYSVEYQACKAYNFLVKYWEPGDKIYLVGFSRGAYSVRAVAGMLRNMGLLRPELAHLTDLGWNFYADKDFRALARFQSAFGRKEPVRVHFIGVWDTVSAFGKFTSPRTLPSTANNKSVDHVRHAMAIDEKRACFNINKFSYPDGTTPRPEYASFKEVWFPGVHGDVGGGFEENESGLSKISLEWMYGEAAALGCNFNTNTVRKFLGLWGTRYIAPNAGQSPHNSMTSYFKLMEFLPRREWSMTKEQMVWKMPNLFNSRNIPVGHDLFHECVIKKLDIDKGYSPRNLPQRDQMEITHTAHPEWLL